ncbi:3-oxoacyl-[acyl-carrier-protein] reductase [Petrocella sp. FN5]|uniref:3-oxoacyl-[acyl-carrier-protein] reductase n=1 Tax=Petrocella sp. FN5 TaxID=3032002 RepID=UPI0023DC2688|nr:3-oxoacyl-[acyl-carrier-protein] reductase [Petrocella sp. FN5]MDF1617438.1 3-oxoacyl-[acyl-carrier-protein] reductase [Petrocella sp. FN5]
MADYKVALITGGNTGIGKVIALELAKEGHDILLNYIFDEAAALEVKSQVETIGSRCELLYGDISDFGVVEKMMEDAFKVFGRIDVLVNNAGITRDNLIMRMSEDEFDAVINVNLKGTFNCCKHIARKMLKQKEGKIINIASIVGVMGNVGQVNYSASKAGVIGLTKTLAREFASRGIKVNAIAPGFIKTAMTDKMPEQARTEMIANIPLNRLGEPKDIADLVVFLASDKADYITGQIIGVNGGLYI